MAERQVFAAKLKIALVPEDRVWPIQVCHHKVEPPIAVEVADRQPSAVGLIQGDHARAGGAVIECMRHESAGTRLRLRQRVGGHLHWYFSRWRAGSDLSMFPPTIWDRPETRARGKDSSSARGNAHRATW